MGFRIVPVTPELLTDMFTTGYQMPPRNCKSLKCVAGLPDGAELADVRMSDDGRYVLFKFAHDGWSTPPGCAIEHMNIEWAAESVPPAEMTFDGEPKLLGDWQVNDPLPIVIQG